ncbi:MAG: hypothetical protein AAF289_20640 [Cyanobacteria bacterium P01_A01_bin.135]
MAFGFLDDIAEAVDDIELDFNLPSLDLPNFDLPGFDLPDFVVDVVDDLGGFAGGLVDRLEDVDLAQVATPGNQRLIGTVAVNLLLGGAAADIISGLAGNDILVGDIGRDWLKGGRGRDLLLGGDGADRLWGNGGQDILDGGPGRNTATGGLGRDFFVLDDEGRLTIRDFKRRDRLVLDEDIGLGEIDVVQRGRSALVTLGDQVLAVLRGVDAGVVGDRIAESDILDSL